jgi:hypothetical protein
MARGTDFGRGRQLVDQARGRRRVGSAKYGQQGNMAFQYSVQGIGRYVSDKRRGGYQGKAARGKGNVGSYGSPTRGGWSGPW